MDVRRLLPRAESLLRRHGQATVLCALLAAVVVFGRVNLKETSAAGRAPRTTASSPAPAHAPLRAVQVHWPLRIDRNPFTSAERADPAPPPRSDAELDREQLRAQASRALRISSIVHGPTPWAVVNGRIVRRGDLVEGYLIVRFNERGIVVQRDGVDIELHF